VRYLKDLYRPGKALPGIFGPSWPAQPLLGNFRAYPLRAEDLRARACRKPCLACACGQYLRPIRRECGEAISPSPPKARSQHHQKRCRQRFRGAAGSRRRLLAAAFAGGVPHHVPAPHRDDGAQPLRHTVSFAVPL
jgi:hypothetical protein